MDQPFKYCFMIAFLISTVSVGFALDHASDAATQQYFWTTMLPNTPIPQPLLDALLPKPAHEDSNKEYDGQVPLSQKVDELGYEPPSPGPLLKQDTATSIFILEKDLTPGANLKIHFTKLSQAAYPPFPNGIQSMPPFSSNNLPQLLRFFSVSSTSKAALIMNQTLARCEHPNPINGLVQFCATSLKKMVTYVTQTLRDTQNIRAVSMGGVRTDALMPYRILGVNQIIAQDRSLIACHRLSFPYGVYYCHQPRGATTFSVSLVGVNDGAKLDAYAMCHHQTADWSDDYIAFKVLAVKPGSTVCHFFQPDNVIFYRAS
ncbi:hypothetical protein SOVF_010300 [Spinacia oleracea]|uniref:BURP domain-containing protein 6-like n=1 Tax=Spinacia oleracea TaxID=3562 RepID=A0A9R0JZZ9_SPIOL|nr:BURP domain-containing protein 6-like [Spinacia oleracea]KNA25023.1 hypothetical protein SOVF_010300 [Spinacia oleracea]